MTDPPENPADNPTEASGAKKVAAPRRPAKKPEAQSADAAPDRERPAGPPEQRAVPARHPRDQRPDHRPEQRPDHRPEPRPEQRPQRTDRPLDGRELSDHAWQLFAGELREEGIELVDDAEAEKLSQRCFRLAEIFLRMRQRRLQQWQGGGGPEDRRREEWRPQQKREERPGPALRPKEDREQVSREQAEAVIEQAHEQAAKAAQQSEAPL